MRIIFCKLCRCIAWEVLSFCKRFSLFLIFGFWGMNKFKLLGFAFVHYLRCVALFALVCFCGVSTCDPGTSQYEGVHPIWRFLNQDEDKLDKDTNVITKLGLGRLRFHVTDQQEYLNDDMALNKNQNNIVDTDNIDDNWVLTPHFYGHVTKAAFPKTMAVGINHQYGDDARGVPEHFIEELLALKKDDAKQSDIKKAVIIISTGFDGRLGACQKLKDVLKQKKLAGEIQDYVICTSRYAALAHNKHVKAKNPVFTFIHTND